MNFTGDLVPEAVAAKGCLARRQIEVFGVVLLRTEPLEPPKDFLDTRKMAHCKLLS